MSKAPFPTIVRMMSLPELAYLGGILDGEGYITQHASFGQGRKAPRIVVTITDLEIVSALLRFTGVGNVSLHRDRKHPERKTAWTWACSRRNDVAEILRQLKVTKTSIKAGD